MLIVSYFASLTLQKSCCSFLKAIIAIAYITVIVGSKSLGQFQSRYSTDASLHLTEHDTLISYLGQHDLEYLSVCSEKMAIKQSVNLTQIKQLMDEFHIPGLSMRVITVDSDEPLFEASVGVLELVPPFRLVSSASIFNLASVTKTFTAVAAMILVERGILDLDIPISGYLSQFDLPRISNPFFVDDEITMRHLLTHTSSIGDATGITVLPDDLFLNVPLQNFVLQQLLPDGNFYNPNSWLNASIGTRFHYANTGLALAGLVVELVAQQPYFDFVTKNVLTPLNMTSDSHWTLQDYVKYDQLDLLSEHYSYNTSVAEWRDEMPFMGYEPFVDGRGDNSWVRLTTQYSYLPSSAGQLRSSVGSLSRHLLMFMRNGRLGADADAQQYYTKIVEIGKLLSPASIAELQRIQYPNINSHQGLVYFQFHLLEKRWVIGHDGALPGTRTMMFTDPAAGLGVVLLSNGCVGGPNHYQNVVVGAAVDQIVEYLFEAFDTRH